MSESMILTEGTLLIELNASHLISPSGVDVYKILSFEEGFVALFRNAKNYVSLMVGDGAGGTSGVEFCLSEVKDRGEIIRVVATWNRAENTIKLYCMGTEVASGPYVSLKG